MSKKLKILIVVIISLAVIGSTTAWFMWNKPHRNVKDAEAIQTTSIDLYNSFLKDSATAKTTYTNKVVEISGEVTQVNHNQQNQSVILLKTNTPAAAINCTMEDTADIKAGETIHIKGICNGYNSGDADMGIPGDVLLVRCYKTN
jgi:hypothetical protein